MNSAPTPPYLKSLSECHRKLEKDGYTESFSIVEGDLNCLSCDKKYKPSEIKIVNFFRFEGETDPEDSSIMYVIEAADGMKGTIVDAYGAYADPDISEFIIQVENIEKKMIKK